MIDWQLTKEILGDVGPLKFNPRVIKICDGCGKQDNVRYKSYQKCKPKYFCRSCIVNRPEVKAKLSVATSKQWEDPSFRELVSDNCKKNWRNPEIAKRMTAYSISEENKQNLIRRNKEAIDETRREKLSQNAKEIWQRDDYREKIIKSSSATCTRLWTDPEYRKKMALHLSARWDSIEYSNKIIAAIKEKWSEPEFRQKMHNIMNSIEYKSKIADSMRKVWDDKEYQLKMASTHTVSTIQTILYSILDDLKVKYYQEHLDATPDLECLIGPYSFDCVIPRNDKPILLIECQGDYWHSRKEVQIRDKAKFSYIHNNFPEKYEIKYLWEHEFLQKDRIVETVKYWLGITQLQIAEFEFDQIEIRDCPAEEYKLLLAKYHYLSNARRGGIAFGAYLNNILVAICIFSPLVRQNIPLDCPTSQALELSRFCIHPSYQKHNFGSWFISRCIKRLPTEKYKIIISYCDTTYNHDGAIYKACNFTQDKIVPSDYWYTTSDGWAMHKKTLYNHASKMKMTEADFAAKFGYQKIYGKEKLRYIWNLTTH